MKFHYHFFGHDGPASDYRVQIGKGGGTNRYWMEVTNLARSMDAVIVARGIGGGSVVRCMRVVREGGVMDNAFVIFPLEGGVA